MRDFPVFDTETGVSSLILKEVPYRKTAYIHIRDVEPGGLDAHLRECVGFCRAVGAERIFAAGHEALTAYPLYTAVVEMTGSPSFEEGELASLFPVTEQTVSRWRELYNQRMAGVDNAGTLEARQEPEILSGGTYFVHDGGELLGIGWLEEGLLRAMASVKPGAGERVMRTLLSACAGETLRLEVASTNEKALRLYERLGFFPTREIIRWYQVG